MSAVSHLAAEPLAPSALPRKITVFLSAPPGDGTRPAREHFHEYVKPLLVAAALDWDVVEGRREGDVRARWAERIRNQRRLAGEKGEVPPDEDPVEEVRRQNGIKEADETGGHLVIGRHTWKEYVRGLHEGWLGPLDPPLLPSDATPALDASTTSDANSPLPSTEGNPTATPSDTQTAEFSSDASPPESSDTKPPDPPSPTKAPVPTPYISPASYPQAPLPPTLPTTLPATTAIPLPHLLGFRYTPWRTWRFLHRREAADDAGRRVAALVLATRPRAFERRPGAAAAEALGDGREAGAAWEQQGVLAEQEADWHKSARADRKGEGEEGREEGEAERPWREPVVVDERVGERMRTYGALLGKLRGDDEAGERAERRGKSRKWLGGADERWDQSWGEWAKGLVGLEKEEGRKGWEDGFIGEE